MGSRPVRSVCKFLLATSVGAVVYLAFEAVHPPERQPSAMLCLAMIDLYQSVGSSFARKCGVRCKYQPSCSHYAEQAIGKYGTVRGTWKAVGRLWRCSPWDDGSGEDRP